MLDFDEINAKEEEEKTKKYRDERKVVLVGKEGQYKTLDEAIRDCDEFSIIYLEEGVYVISQPVTKPGLIIQKKDMDKKVFIMANEGPVVTVDMKNFHFVVFKDITFLHSGICISAKFKESAMAEP